MSKKKKKKNRYSVIIGRAFACMVKHGSVRGARFKWAFAKRGGNGDSDGLPLNTTYLRIFLPINFLNFWKATRFENGI